MTPPLKILFVDDDPSLLAAFQRNLRRQFTFDTATGGAEALALLRRQPDYALLVVDMRMPGMDGIEFLEQARKIVPDAVRMMLTGNADQQTAVDAVNRGEVFRFLNKPCPPEALVPALEHGLKQYELVRMERELLEGTLTGSVKALSEVLGMVAPNSLGRGQRLQECMRKFALFFHATPVWELEIAALLSSIGHASLPPTVLEKSSSGEPLTLAEETLLRRSPQAGHNLLIDIPRLAEVARIVLYQNKAFDGSGFPPDDCKGEQIPLGARMLKILDDRLVLEADGVVKQRAFEEMRARSGVYDPRLLELCFACFETFLAYSISSERPVRSLYVKELTVDQVVVSDIRTLDGQVLVGAGYQLTPTVMGRLQNYDLLGQVQQPVLVQDPAPKAAAGSGR
jgi:response regulator RpfG family c-di-GMP phosphodiesterase